MAVREAGRKAEAAIADPRGHGASGGTYGFNLHEHHDISAVACDILGHLPVHSISLAGFSYGASIAISGFGLSSGGLDH